MPLPDFAVTRFPNGVNNVAEANIAAGVPFPFLPGWHQYFNDFDEYVAADWVVTETQAGATQALAAGDGGLLLLTNTAADDDLVSLQKTPANFSMTAAKKAFFECKFEVSEATQIDVLVGLLIVTATPFTTPTDGIFFEKLDGATAWTLYCRKDATTGSTSLANVATLAAATQVRLGWYYDGAGQVYAGVNGALVGSLAAPSTFFPDATNLVPTFSVRNGDAVARTMTVDYIYMAKER